MNNEKPKIACLPNGPYYLLNDLIPKTIPNLQDAKGDLCATVTGVALCRCGGSNNKPFKKSEQTTKKSGQTTFSLYA